MKTRRKKGEQLPPKSLNGLQPDRQCQPSVANYLKPSGDPKKTTVGDVSLRTSKSTKPEKIVTRKSPRKTSNLFASRSEKTESVLPNPVAQEVAVRSASPQEIMKKTLKIQLKDILLQQETLSKRKISDLSKDNINWVKTVEELQSKIVDLEKRLDQKSKEVVTRCTEMSEIELKLDSLNIELTEKNDKLNRFLIEANSAESFKDKLKRDVEQMKQSLETDQKHLDHQWKIVQEAKRKNVAESTEKEQALKTEIESLQMQLGVYKRNYDEWKIEDQNSLKNQEELKAQLKSSHLFNLKLKEQNAIMEEGLEESKKNYSLLKDVNSQLEKSRSALKVLINIEKGNTIESTKLINDYKERIQGLETQLKDKNELVVRIANTHAEESKSKNDLTLSHAKNLKFELQKNYKLTRRINEVENELERVQKALISSNEKNVFSKKELEEKKRELESEKKVLETVSFKLKESENQLELQTNELTSQKNELALSKKELEVSKTAALEEIESLALKLKESEELLKQSKLNLEETKTDLEQKLHNEAEKLETLDSQLRSQYKEKKNLEERFKSEKKVWSIIVSLKEEEIDLLKKSSKRKAAADLTTSSSPNAKKRRTENLVNDSDVTELPPVPEEREDLETVEALSSTGMSVVEQPRNEKSPKQPSEVESTESEHYDSSDRTTEVDYEMKKRMWKMEIAETVKEALHLFYKKEIEKKEDFEGAAKTFTEMFFTTALDLAAENQNFTLSSTFLKEIYDQVKFHFKLKGHIQKCLSEQAVKNLSIEEYKNFIESFHTRFIQELREGYKSYHGNYIGIELTADHRSQINSAIKCYLENM